MVRLIVCTLTLALPLGAQDVIRGRVVGADSTPIRNASVSVAAATQSWTTRSDTAGAWLIRTDVAAASYNITIIALGMAPIRRTVPRRADGQPIVIDIVMKPAVVALDAVRVNETRRRPPQRDPNGLPIEQSSSERGVEPAPGAVAASDQGSLAAMAASVPGISLIPDANGGPPGFSVLGLSPDQNNVTLNGMQFSGGDIPRDAVAFTRVTTSSFDVSRGGFSGGQLAIGAFAGSNFHDRLAHITFDSPQLQFTDRVGRQLGTQYTNAQVSGSATGPIVLDKVFYSVSFQTGRRSSPLQSLLTSDALTLDRIGVAHDSVSRLAGALERLGIPFATSVVPANRYRDNASLLARVDWQRSREMTANVVASVRHSKATALFLAPTAVPGHGGDDRTNGADVTGTLSLLVHKNVLSDLRLGAHVNDSRSDPYLDLPDARVLVSSHLSDGSGGLAGLQFGGNAFLPRSSRASGAELFEQVSWLSESGRHRFRATTDLRYDALTQSQSPNQRGSYFYNSIADVEANQPAVFARTLASQAVTADVFNGALAAGDAWRPTDRSQILFGARVEGTGLDAPREVHVSPRAGIAWGLGNRGTKGFPGAPRFFLRAGIGEFRNSVSPSLLVPALRSASLEQIQCIGAAVPTPDWSAFRNDASTIPTQCLGNSVFAATQPNIYRIGSDFAAQRSWRANASAQGPLVSKWLVLQIEGIYSRNLHQQAPIDLNFDPRVRFVADGGRPVYVLPSSIVSSSGALTNRDSRRDAQFGTITELTSNLRSEGRQMIVTLSPLTFLPGFTWTMNYVAQSLRDQSRGFGGSTAGNPLDVEWGRSALDARHQFNGSITVRMRDAVSLSLWGRVSSGLPFTPMVSNDVNGDGLANDRAFVVDSLPGAPRRIRDCLARQVGRLAERSSCEGPWTATSNAVLTLNPEKLGLQNRTTLTLSLTNIPAGLDAMLHGTSRLQGWGQSSVSDPTLLTVRGFDPSTNRYRYEVNPRFGDTRVSRSGTRAPFLVTLEARVQLGRVQGYQAMEQVMAVGRTQGGDKLTPTQLKIRLMQTVLDPVRQLIAVKDSLTIITRQQLQQLTALQRRMTAQQDSIWTPVAEYLASQSKSYDKAAAMERIYAAQLEVFDGVVVAMREVKQILAPEQIRELPPFMLLAFDEKTLMLAKPSMSFFPVF